METIVGHDETVSTAGGAAAVIEHAYIKRISSSRARPQPTMVLCHGGIPWPGFLFHEIQSETQYVSSLTETP